LSSAGDRTRAPIEIVETGRRILDDQLTLYRRYDAGFATWRYRDLGRQGLTHVRPESPYGELVADFVCALVLTVTIAESFRFENCAGREHLRDQLRDA
jgi:hypothetical protein